MNHDSAVLALRSLSTCCLASSNSTLSSSSLSSEPLPTVAFRHAWLGSRNTRAHRLLISGSAVFLHMNAGLRARHERSRRHAVDVPQAVSHDSRLLATWRHGRTMQMFVYVMKHDSG